MTGGGKGGASKRDRRLRRCGEGLKVEEVKESCKEDGRWKSRAEEITGVEEEDVGRGMREEWQGVEERSLKGGIKVKKGKMREGSKECE